MGSITRTQSAFPRGHGHKIVAATLIGAALLLIALIPTFNAPFERFDYYGLVATRPAPDFLLRDTEGKPVRLLDFRGKFVYLMFGYLSCDRVCHSQSLTLQMLNQDIRDTRVQFIFIGMDPERDTSNRIRQYFDSRAPNFTGLVATSLEEAQSVAADYRAFFNTEPDPDGRGYGIAHPGFIYLIDPEGNIRLIYTGTTLNTSKMLEDLRHLFQEFT